VACQVDEPGLVVVNWLDNGECFCGSDYYSHFLDGAASGLFKTDYSLCPAGTSSSSSSATPTTTTTATATPSSPACCSNGVFTDDIAKACNLTPNYGDGQCYGQYEINCKGGYTFEIDTTNLELSPVELNLGDCLQFCVSFGNPFGDDWTALNLINNNDFTGPYWQCDCLSAYSGFQNYQTPGQQAVIMSMTFCPTGPPQVIEFPCCEPYTGDFTQACVDPSSPDYGDRKCLPGSYEVSS
jgi:hypothetical protein